MSNEEYRRLYLFLDLIYVPMVVDDHHWNQRSSFLEKDFKIQSKFENFKNIVDTEYDGDADKVWATTGNFTKACNNYLIGKKEYEQYILKDREIPEIFKSSLSSKTYFENGRTYLSIDLVQAFNQALSYYNVLNGKTWDEFVSEQTDSNLIKNSKYLRICCWPESDKIQITNVTYEMLETLINSQDELFKLIKELNLPIMKILVDELVYDITGHEDAFKQFVSEDRTVENIHIHVRMYRWDSIFYRTCGDRYRSLGVKYMYGEAVPRYIGVKNNIFFPQAYKLYYGLEITEDDLAYPSNNGFELTNQIEPMRREDAIKSQVF